MGTVGLCKRAASAAHHHVDTIKAAWPVYLPTLCSATEGEHAARSSESQATTLADQGLCLNFAAKRPPGHPNGP